MKTNTYGTIGKPFTWPHFDIFYIFSIFLKLHTSFGNLLCVYKEVNELGFLPSKVEKHKIPAFNFSLAVLQ